MSLHTLANHLQTAGRGDDSLLVHMTPNEVNGLQSLAMAHGGSLSINPETGLPEAGFLSSILPMVAGVALNAAFPGLGAVGAGLITGAAGAAATGSLSKGLMMGLGAYGGAGLGAGLMGGAASGASALGSAGAAQVAANQAATATTLGSTTPWGGLAGAGGAGAGTAALNPTANAIATASGTYVPPGSPLPPATNVFGGAMPTNAPVVASNIVSPTTGLPVGANAPASSVLDKVKGIPGKLGDLLSGSGPEADKAREDFLKENKKYLLTGGLSALSLSREDPKGPPREAPAQEFNPNYRPSTGQYTAGPMYGKSSERAYSFYADGGVTGQPSSQVGQPVEQMSQENSVGANTNYPMANSKPYGYAVPKNYPVSQNVFQPDSYERVDPYTGEQKFADGGLATLHFKSGGAFISKLAAVKAPTKATPKLADTKKLETEIGKLKSYGSSEEQTNKYNDLTQQIKDRQSEKENKARELAEREKSYKTDLARMKTEQANRTKEINNEYADKVKSFGADTAAEVKNRQADIKNTKNKNEQKQKQTDLANYQKDRNNELANINKDKASALSDAGSEVANFTKDFNNFKTEVGKFNKDIETQVGAFAKQQEAAKKAIGFAQQREGKEKQFEQVKSANQGLIDKANQDYETGMSKFNEYQNAVKDEQAKYEEQTKRQATGISSLRAQSTASRISGNPNQSEIDKLTKEMNSIQGGLGTLGQKQTIQKQIDDLKKEYSSGAAGTSSQSGIYTPKYMKDANGNLVPYAEKATFNKYTKAPGYDGTTRIMDESDVKNLFQDVAGRSPTAAEMDKYLGMKTTDAALAGQIMKLPDVAGNTTFSDDDLKDNFKYYLGRDPNAGEIANMKQSKLTNFNSLRNYLQAQPAYVDNLNKIGTSLFSSAMTQQETAAAQEARAGKPLTADEVATSYKDALSRDPTMDELRKYMGSSTLPTDLTKQLRSSDEYLSSLTKPLVPGLQQGDINTTALAAPKYAPGTTLSYTPEQQAQTGLGSITGGLQPTATGMQQPLNRGQVTIEGALPLNPTGQEQLGLQTLYGQLANQAPSLQTGMKFAAPEQSMFGFQPYAAPQNPQSIEAILAALKAQQAQQAPVGMADGGMAGYNLGGYSDGGRLLRGPGDGVSDSIPATIGNRQPARLADGEFVVPARIVSELGNGSTDAGAKKLYAMMQRIQQARGKTVGRDKVAVNSRAEKLLPA